MDLHIFADFFHTRTLRFHMMIGNPRFGNYLSFSVEPRNGMMSVLHVSNYFNEKYYTKEYQDGYKTSWVERSWKLLLIPDLLTTLWYKRFQKQCREFENKPTTGLGALFS